MGVPLTCYYRVTAVITHRHGTVICAHGEVVRSMEWQTKSILESLILSSTTNYLVVSTIVNHLMGADPLSFQFPFKSK